MKFKKGDTVEVVKGAWCGEGFKPGHRGVVTDIFRGLSYPYEVTRRNGNIDVFSARELKLIRKGK